MIKLLRGLVPILPLFFLFSQPAAGVGNDNPTGVAGEYNGSITTAGSYDPYTGNAKRFVDDLPVTGGLGVYPLKWSRVLNTRAFPQWSHSYAWALWVRPYQDYEFEPDPYEGPGGELEYPDGRKITYALPLAPYTYEPASNSREPQDYLVHVGAGNYDLRMRDGGKVKFRRAAGSTNENDPLFATEIVDPYGQTTLLIRDSARRLWQIKEPGGRYLQINYTTYSRVYDGETLYWDVISSVQAYAAAGQLIETVTYSYNTAYEYRNTFTYLTQANYADGSRALYTYQDGLGNTTPTGLIKTCDDVRFAGPMKKIEYEYQQWDTTHRFSAQGQVKKEKNATTHQTVSEVIYPPDYPVLSTPDPARYVRTEVRGDGSTRSFQYSTDWTAPELESHTDFKNQRSYIDYGTGSVPSNYVKILTDARGNTTKIEKDAFGDTTRIITHPDLSTVQFTYTSNYYLASKTDERGYTTHYDRDANKRISQIRYPDGGLETFSYNIRGQVLTHRLTSGGTETFEYDNGADTRGLKTRHWAPATPGDPTPAPTVYVYYQTGPHTDRLLSVTDPRGNTTSYQYNLRGQVTRVTHPDGFYTQSGYNTDGTLAWTADEKHPGAATDVNQRTRYVYDEYKRVVSVTNPLNQTATSSYDPWNASNSLSHTTSSVYRATSPMGKLTDHDYDANFRPIRTTQAAGTTIAATTTSTYDPAGNLETVTEPNGQPGKIFAGKHTSFGYDNRNRKIWSLNPLNQRTEWDYDDASNVLSIKQPDNTTDSKTYDSMNRVLTEKDEAMNRTTTFSYSYLTVAPFFGTRQLVTDAKNQRTRIVYDARGLKRQITYENLDYQAWTYDANNNPISRRTAAAVGAAEVYQKFSYDSRNRKTVMWWGTTSDPANQTGIVWATGIDRSTFTYEANGALSTANNSFSNITRTYDAAGRLVSDAQTVAGLALRTVQYTYDADGQATRLYVTNGNGYDHRYTYDAMGRLDKIRDSLNADEFGYSYDASSNETQRLNYYNSVAQVYGRDAGNRLTRCDLKIGTAVSFAYEAYGYNGVNQVLSIDREDSRRDLFGYNFAGELTSAQYGLVNNVSPLRTATYTLDTVGNRTLVVDAGVSKTYVPDILNRYTSVGGVAVTHGPAHQIGAYQANSYQYVGDTYLASMGGPASYTLGYDALGRCVRRRLQGVITYYVYDGEKPILEYKSDGTLAGWNLYGKGIDEVLMRADYVAVPGGQGYFYQQNHLGSVTHLTGWAGETIEKYSYDAYGAPTTTYTGGVFNNRFKFTGREYASSFGVYEYRNRAYHPGLGRFVSEDPLGFSAGDYNLFRYCGNDPVNQTDPMGLVSTSGIRQYSTLTSWLGGDWIKGSDGLSALDWNDKWRAQAGMDGGGGGNDNGKFFGAVRRYTGMRGEDVEPKEIGRAVVTDARDAAKATARTLRPGKGPQSGRERTYAEYVNGRSLVRNGPRLGDAYNSGHESHIPPPPKGFPDDALPLSVSHSHGPGSGRGFQGRDLASSNGADGFKYISSVGYYGDNGAHIVIHVPYGGGYFHSTDGANFYSGTGL